MGRLLNINGWQAIKIMLVLNKLCIKTRNIIIVYGYFFSHTIDILCEAPCLLAQPLKAWLDRCNATCYYPHRVTDKVRIWLNNTCRLELCTWMRQQSVKMIKVNMILTIDEHTTSVSASITTTATHTISHDFLEEFAIELVMSVQGR